MYKNRIHRFDELNVGDLILIEATSNINSAIKCLNRPVIFLSYEDLYSYTLSGIVYTSSGNATIVGSDIIRLLARFSEAIDG